MVTAVTEAEAILSIKSPVIYTFVGCLHPDLGTVGLILSPECIQGRLQGVTRCDSGGLAGRLGSFVHVNKADVPGALRELSVTGENPPWYPLFVDELAKSYSDSADYVRGTVPDYATWKDVRAHCIAQPLAPGDILDRRLWTWEVRLTTAPDPTHYEAIVLSHEALKQVEALHVEGHSIPDDVKVLFGTISAAGVHYFLGESVFDVLGGI